MPERPLKLVDFVLSCDLDTVELVMNTAAGFKAPLYSKVLSLDRESVSTNLERRLPIPKI